MNFQSKKFNLLFNIAFWSAYFLYEWLANASLGNEYRRYLINAAVLVPLTLLAAVFTVHVSFDKFYMRNKVVEFWVSIIVSATMFVLLRRSFNYFYTYPHYFPEALAFPFLFVPKFIIEAVNIYLVVSLYSMIYFVKAWYEQQRITQELSQKKTEAELQLLRSQVQPHFIFNTLNNIYSYAIQGDARVPILIHRLSSFLSYNLYETKSDHIALSKELEYIKSYIELERLRHAERLDVSFNVYNDISNVKISPMLLLPLVENCFKHGVTPSAESCWIRIDISHTQGWLSVKIENSTTSQITRNGHSGLGLENVKRRLAILYPGQHEFRSIQEKDSFITIVKIKDAL